MAPQKPTEGLKLITENRRAAMRYEVTERFEVGIVLMGSEVKSIRAGKMELGDAYALVRNGELSLLNAYVAPYPFATMIRHEEKRDRKLLASRDEIDRLDGLISQRGFTLIPLKAYWKGPHVKVELGLARGKQHADQREDIKKREGEREARAAMARHRER